MKQRILILLKQYLEFILLALTIIVVFSKTGFPKYGDRISMLLFGTVAFYYLASGVLVFLDKERVVRSMRLIYIIGLWGVSICTLGIMARIHLIQSNTELLYIALIALASSLFFGFLAIRQYKESENKKAYKWQLQPLILRAGIAFILGIGILLINPYTVYHTFGTYREDPYITKQAVYVYEHPEDTAANREFEMIIDSLLQKKNGSDQD